MTRMQAALQGAREVAFTVLAMRLSLIAVFVPILLMGGIIGRMFREFAVTLSVAIVISLIVSLTTTPMMCAYLLAARCEQASGRLNRAGERIFGALLSAHGRILRRVLRWPALVVLSLGAMVSDWTAETISEALERCRVRDVVDWCRRRLRQSVQSQRSQAYNRLEGATKPG